MKTAPETRGWYDTQEAAGSEEILNCRGSFYRINLKPGTGPGFYSVQPLRDDFFSPDTPVLINSITTQQRDLVSEMACLDNFKVFTVYGQAFGQVLVQAEILLGDFHGNNYHITQRLQDWFDKYRVSRYKRPIKLSIGSSARFAYLTGMAVGNADATYQTLPFGLSCTLLDISAADIEQLNPKGVVLNSYNVGEPSLIDALKAPAELDDRNSALLVDMSPEALQKKEIERVQLYLAGAPDSAESVIAYKVATEQALTGPEQQLEEHYRQIRKLEASGDDYGVDHYFNENRSEMSTLRQTILTTYNPAATAAQLKQ